jgi:sigma-E factor negative regulatory protein RseA
MLTNKRKEKISALLDDDMHRDELMSFSLSAEPEDAEAARRYQMIGEALRGEMSDAVFVDVSHAVREALDDEVSYNIDVTESRADARTDKGPAAEPKGLFASWFRPAAGMAVAASVAVVLVMAVSQQETTINSTVAEATPAQTLTPVRVAIDEKAAANKPGKINHNADQRLINRHLEYATQDALQGRLPLVRSVSYEADR